MRMHQIKIESDVRNENEGTSDGQMGKMRRFHKRVHFEPFNAEINTSDLRLDDLFSDENIAKKTNKDHHLRSTYTKMRKMHMK